MHKETGCAAPQALESRRRQRQRPLEEKATRARRTRSRATSRTREPASCRASGERLRAPAPRPCRRARGRMPHTTLRASLHPRAGPRLTPPAVVAPQAAPAPPRAAPRTTTRQTTTTVRRTTCCARPTTTPSRRQHRAHTRLASASRRRGQQIWVATSARPPARPTLALTLTLALALTPSPEHLVAFAACLAVGQPSLPEPSSEPSLRRPQYASGLSTRSKPMNVETCGHVADLIVMAHAFAELRDGVVARQHEERFQMWAQFRSNPLVKYDV